MPDLTDTPLGPDYGEIEKGNYNATSDAIALLYALVIQAKQFLAVLEEQSAAQGQGLQDVLAGLSGSGGSLVTVFQISVPIVSGADAQDEVLFATGVTLTDSIKAYFVAGFTTEIAADWRIVDNTQMGFSLKVNTPADAWAMTVKGWIVEAR